MALSPLVSGSRKIISPFTKREDCKSIQGKNCRSPILDGVEFGMLEKPPNGDVYEVTEMELKEIH